MSRLHPAAGRRYQHLCTGCLAAFRERFAPRHACPRCGDAGVALLPGNLPPVGPERVTLAARLRREMLERRDEELIRRVSCHKVTWLLRQPRRRRSR